MTKNTRFLLLALVMVLLTQLGHADATTSDATEDTTTVGYVIPAEVQVCWEPVLARVDGTPLRADEIAHYEVSIESPLGEITTRLPKDATKHEFTITSYGETCARMRVVDVNDIPSEWVARSCVLVVAPPVKLNLKPCG